MMRRFFTILTAVCLIASSSAVWAGDHGSHCPRCHEVCYPTVTKGTETKSCWNVDTKVICIPKVRFPWEMGCTGKGDGKGSCLPPKPGRTKCVNVLVRHEYECAVCEYSWNADGLKNGGGDYKHKAMSPPADPDADVPPPPPPIEARLQRQGARVLPARFDQTLSSDPGSEARRSFSTIVKDWLK